MTYLIHSIRPGYLMDILKDGVLRTNFCRYANRSGIWFSMLPKLTDKLYTNHTLAKENIIFYNIGCVFVFKNNLKYCDRIGYGLYNRYNMTCKSLEKHIQNKFNDIKHTYVSRPCRWYCSHEVISNKDVILKDNLKCILAPSNHCVYDEIMKYRNYIDYPIFPLSIGKSTFSDMYEKINY